MTEGDNRRIDVEELVGRIRSDAQSRQPGASSAPVVRADGENVLNAIEAQLNIASAKAEVRTRWPGSLRFPLFRVGLVRRPFLKALEFLFKDQRHVNQSLIAAMHELVAVNRALTERVAALERERHAE
jgi:hypothetical protein